MKTKLRTSNFNPRSIARALFHKPFNPTVNFALEDPLLLNSHPCAEKEGLEYTQYFGANSNISTKAPEFLERKTLIEANFSELMQVEKSLILSYEEDCLERLGKSFLSSQKYFVPDSILSPFPKSQTIYFSASNISSLIPLLKKASDHLPIVLLPKITAEHGRIDYPLVESIKEQIPFFLIIEDKFTFGLEGLNGFSNRRENKLADLLITHIPKTFGKMLTILSGATDLLDTLMEYSFHEVSLFPPAAYLGMLDASLSIIPTLSNRRDAIKSFIEKIKQKFQEDLTIYNPLLSFNLSSYEEKQHFAKSLVDKGFLLPSSSFTKENSKLTFHLNYLLEEKSIHSIHEIKHAFTKQSICESI